MASDEASEHTFLFADLSGFTALTEVHGDEEAADLAAGFFGEARAVLAVHGGEEVKTVGDAVMIRCDSAADVIALALRMVQEVGTRHGFPSVRVGLSTGPAVERDGDWFGSTVNLAARLSGVATGGEVLLTAASAGAAGGPGRGRSGCRAPRTGTWSCTPAVGARCVMSPSRWSCSRHPASGPDRPRGSRSTPYRMAVDPENAAGTLLHEGAGYHFCSLECARLFAEAPDRYAGSLEER